MIKAMLEGNAKTPPNKAKEFQNKIGGNSNLIPTVGGVMEAMRTALKRSFVRKKH